MMKLRLPGLLLLLASGAFADIITLPVNMEFSGTEPAGTAPWMTLTFEDILTGDILTEGVRLTIANVGLTGSEKNKVVYWNLNPAKVAGNLIPTAIGTMAGTQTTYKTFNAGTNAFKAGGDDGAMFDYQLDLLTSNAQKLTAGETFVLEWINLGLTAADFNHTNASGFYGAAHILSIGPNDSGWIGGKASLTINPQGDPSPVPEPLSVVLLGTALIGLSYALRKHFAAR